MLGNGWLGKLLLAALAAIGGWILRHPAEAAATGALLDKRFNEFIALQDAQIAGLRQQIVDDRKLCDAQLKALREHIERLESSTRALELRQWPRQSGPDGIIGGEGLS